MQKEEEEDVPTVCDRLKDKWQLPQEEYSMFVSCFVFYSSHVL